jgi:hypothetical protein
MKTTVKLTTQLLKKIIQEESAKFGDMKDTEKAAKETEEVDADEYADSLAKHVDFVKALKIEEARIVKRLAKIREQKTIALKKIVKNL